MNKTFLKTLTILYVEDDGTTRIQLGKSLNRLFKNVILASNGEDGLEKFKQLKDENVSIDIILSDINMPKLNGIQMLEKIREQDVEVPFIFTTARSETEYLLKAIELNVHHYAIKPVNIQEIILRIEEVCEKRYIQSQLDHKSRELKNYINAINHVAVIYTMNTDGNILHANEAFKEVSGYEAEDIEALNLDTILHPSIKRKYIQESWKDILNGKNWTGNTKYLNKAGKTFYLNITIFKIVDADDKDEFVSLGFVTTKESMKQREFHKKVMLNLKEHNQKEFSQNKTIEIQHEQLEKLKALVLSMETALKEEKKKNANHLKQIEFYENSMHNTEEKTDDMHHNLQKKLNTFSTEYAQMKKEKEQLRVKNIKLEEQVEASADEMKKLYERLETYEKRHLELKDLVDFRESQIKLIDPNLLNK